ncbi:MAG: GTP 3',8-cyclase MoaA [Syntrophales bacterium]|nr:GTP 3',8-cyclase MoaA [Syntrophales bacterium]
MIDQYNRDINYLRVSVTDRCNLRCKYCMPKEGLSQIGHNDILRYEEMLRVIRCCVRLGISKVRITGGEPLVRRGIVDFIARLKSVPGLTDISLTTNGILLKQYAADLFAAGMNRINISLDSLNAEKYAVITRGGDLHTVLSGIREADRVGFAPIKINTVAIKGFNDDEILAFARHTLDKPYQIRFIELMPLGNVGSDNNDNYLSNKMVMDVISRAYPLEEVNGEKNKVDGPARLYRIAGGRGIIGFISPVSQHFCRTCNRLRLTADGHLRACLLLDEEVDLKKPLRNGCSDNELEDLIRQAITKKPWGHTMIKDQRHLRKCVKEMATIGG